MVYGSAFHRTQFEQLARLSCELHAHGQLTMGMLLVLQHLCSGIPRAATGDIATHTEVAVLSLHAWGGMPDWELI